MPSFDSSREKVDTVCKHCGKEGYEYRTYAHGRGPPVDAVKITCDDCEGNVCPGCGSTDVKTALLSSKRRCRDCDSTWKPGSSSSSSSDHRIKCRKCGKKRPHQRGNLRATQWTCRDCS